MAAVALWASVASAGDRQEADVIGAATQALQRGDLARLEELAARLGEQPLAAWIEHHRLALRLERGSDEGVAEFLARHEGSYLAERLRGEWVRFLMREQNWAGAWEQYRRLLRPDGEMQCRGLDIRERLGEKEVAREVEEVAARIPLGPACQAIVARLAMSGNLEEEKLWQALRARLARGELKEAKLFAAWLREGPAASAIDAAERQPLRQLAGSEAAVQSRAERELALFALLRLGKSDPRIAATRLQTLEQHFTREERAFLWGRLALAAARGHLPEAQSWFARALALGAVLDDEQLAWRVRAALRQEDWAAVAKAVAALPPHLAERPEWLYWQGRAMAALGMTEKAREAFGRVADPGHFYGQLALDWLGREWRPPSPAAAASEAELAAVGARPDLVRGLALIKGGMRLEGVRSWNWGLDGLSDRELLAAAEYARRAGVIDRAIAAAERTQHEHDHGLRYPLPFFDEAAPLIAAAGLDAAWVYGLMRQESRFVMDARSRAGAKGLMQLMPATAKWVAKKLGMADFRPEKTTDLATNVRLGTNYLRLVLDALDGHPVLAAAAYNAGPSRAKRWRAPHSLEAAIYIETIPFDETRDYVKKVLANTMHYTIALTGKTSSLRRWLPPIPPAGLREDLTELP